MFTSVGHILCVTVDLDFLDVDNLQLQTQGTFNGLQAYKNSKLCNVLMSYYMAGILKGQRVMIHAVDPGNLYQCSSNLDLFVLGIMYL